MIDVCLRRAISVARKLLLSGRTGRANSCGCPHQPLGCRCAVKISRDELLDLEGLWPDVATETGDVAIEQNRLRSIDRSGRGHDVNDEWRPSASEAVGFSPSNALEWSADRARGLVLISAGRQQVSRYRFICLFARISGIRQALDQAVQAQTAQLIGDGALRDRFGIACRQGSEMTTQIGGAEAFRKLPEQDHCLP
jgi:hypothetical protein